MNTEFADLYGVRPSYRAFNFSEGFTEEYVRRRCVQWYNLGASDTVFLGSPSKGTNSLGEPTITGVEALRVVFGTKPKQRLAREGLAEIRWDPAEEEESCLTSTDCARCATGMRTVSNAAKAGCTPSGAQSQSCCDFMAAFRAAPCLVPHLQALPEIEILANLGFQACRLPPLVLDKRCANNLAIRGQHALCSCVDNAGSRPCAAAAAAFVESGGNGTSVVSNGAGCPPAAEEGVCTCLADRQSPECAQAWAEFGDSNPGSATILQAANEGNETAAAEVSRILVEDAGCPAVCECLSDVDSPQCVEAAEAYSESNPEFGPAFEAARRNESAASQFEEILANEAGCPDSAEDVCACLTDSRSQDCTAALAAYTPENPDSLAALLSTAPNATANVQVRKILREQAGCAVPRSVALPTVGICVDDPTSEDCAAAVVALFDSLGSSAAADEEIVELLSGSLVNGVPCPVRKDCPPQVIAEQTEQTAPDQMQPEENAPEPPQAASTASVAPPEPRQRYLPTIVRTPLKDEDEARDVVEGWERAWHDKIEEKIKDYKLIKVSWFSSIIPEDVIEDAGEAHAPLILGGYALVLVYMVSYFLIEFENGRPVLSHLPPGPLSAILALAAIIIAVFGTFGIIGLVSMTDVKTSPITPQVVPLLMVGLGINDFFVMATAFRVALGTAKSRSVEDIMAETMAKGGASITLSSLSITAAFALGTLSPVPAIEWFGVHMAIGVVMAYITSATTIPCIIAWDLQRHLSRKPSLVQASVEDASQDSPTDGEKGRAADGPFKTGASLKPTSGMPQTDSGSFLGRFFRRALDSPAYKVAVLVVYIGWLALGVWGITKIERGLTVSETVPKDSNPGRFFSASEEHFNTYLVYLVFRGDQDYADLAVFNESKRTEFEFVTKAHNADPLYGVASALDYYTDYVDSKFCADAVCMDEVEWYWDGFYSEEFASVHDRVQNKCLNLIPGLTCAQLCQVICPQGPPGSPYRCRLSEDEQACYCPWRPKVRSDIFYESPEDSPIESFWTDFFNKSLGGAVSQTFVDFDDNGVEGSQFGVPLGMRTFAFVEDVPAVPDKVKHIQSGRAAVDATAVNAFAFDYVVYGVGEQYENIARNTAIALAISVAVAAFVMMPLIIHWFAAVIVAACVTSAVVIAAGMVHWIGLRLNYTSFVALIVSVGLSVEFCSHITRHFMLSEGDRPQRAFGAVKGMGLAVLNGGITTLLSILPIAFSEYPYFREYFFAQYSVMVGIGLFVGLILLPVLLSTVGPSAFTWRLIETPRAADSAGKSANKSAFLLQV
ncbi:unnamed protein product [Ostreobium quekettii]|uniref:SSD domain-containing protein n=1 Tax=Ostreobium quekettii TaxID=121088 RepID=A0A8S1JBM9_9CHLO|nr:unnamed protein product [Ostreobium quekettii]